MLDPKSYSHHNMVPVFDREEVTPCSVGGEAEDLERTSSRSIHLRTFPPSPITSILQLRVPDILVL